MTSSEARAHNKLRAVIQQKCRDCSGGLTTEVKGCTLVPVYNKRTLVQGCSLWPYRCGEPVKGDEAKLKRARRQYEKSVQTVG